MFRDLANMFDQLARGIERLELAHASPVASPRQFDEIVMHRNPTKRFRPDDPELGAKDVAMPSRSDLEKFTRMPHSKREREVTPDQYRDAGSLSRGERAGRQDHQQVRQSRSRRAEPTLTNKGYGTVSEQRTYQLIRRPTPITDRDFQIEFLTPGVEAFAFTFG
jgi:hypothetical protein